MEKYFFTFGSDGRYPYSRDDYVIVEADSLEQALHLFQAAHPNRRGSSCINCSSWYFEDEWELKVSKYYPNTQPKEIIRLTIERRA